MAHNLALIGPDGSSADVTAPLRNVRFAPLKTDVDRPAHTRRTWLIPISLNRGGFFYLIPALRV